MRQVPDIIKIKGVSHWLPRSPPGERNEALGLLALCWLLAAGVFIAVKWAGAYTPPFPYA